MAGAHNCFPIGPLSQTSAYVGYANCTLVAIVNQSVNTQTSTLAVYDGPSVAAVQAAIGSNSSQVQYPLLFQAVLSGGQVLDLTLGGPGLRMNYGIVLIPNGNSNTDGGWTTIYD